MRQIETIYQKTTFFNCFIVPKISYIAKILPIPKAFNQKIQSLGYSFIWRNKLETLAMKEIILPREEGGLGLVNIEQKNQALLLKTVLDDIYSKKVTSNCEIMMYWIGLRIRKIKKLEPNKPHSENLPIFLKDIPNFIIKLSEHLDFNSDIKTKVIYKFLITEHTNKPKIVSKNPNTNFNNTFKATNKPFLNEFLKEHLFQQIHNILPTKDRLIKCRREVTPECNECSQNENLIHIFKCPKTNPVVKIIARRIEKIYNMNFKPSLKNLLLLDFPGPEKKRNTAIFISANMSLIVWKKRKKPNFIKNFLASFQAKEEKCKHKEYFKKYFDWN